MTIRAFTYLQYSSLMTNKRSAKPKKGTKQLEISQEEFDNLHQRLKSCDNGWVSKLVSICNREIEANPEELLSMGFVDVQKIYNVFNGVVRNAQRRRFIFRVALDFIKKHEQEMVELRSLKNEVDSL